MSGVGVCVRCAKGISLFAGILNIDKEKRGAISSILQIYFNRYLFFLYLFFATMFFFCLYINIQICAVFFFCLNASFSVNQMRVLGKAWTQIEEYSVSNIRPIEILYLRAICCCC